MTRAMYMLLALLPVAMATGDSASTGDTAPAGPAAPPDDVNWFQHTLRLSELVVRVDVLSTADVTLQDGTTRFVETHDVLEVIHQGSGLSVSVGDDIEVNRGRHPHPWTKPDSTEELVLMLEAPVDHVDSSGATRAWYPSSAWVVAHVVEDRTDHARWFKATYAGHGDYVLGPQRGALVSRRFLEKDLHFVWVQPQELEPYETDRNGNQRAHVDQITTDALTWADFLGMLRAAATAQSAR